MKSFTYKALALAAASACGSAALAATVTVTPTQFAAETLTSTTSVKVPNVVLQMGVGRTDAQDFTVVIKPVGSTKFDSASCSTTLPAFSNGVGAANVSVKRASTTECAYEVDVVTGFAAGDNETLTFSNLTINSHGLATVGGEESISIGIWDLGETARIDSSADISKVVANSQRAVSLTATTDDKTVVDVNHSAGPLFGFLAGTGPTGVTNDTADVAIAQFNVNINASLKDEFGNAVTNAIVTQVNFTVAGDFDGLTGVNASVRVENVNAATNATPTVTVSGTAGSQTATFSASGAQLSAAGTATPVTMSLTSAKTKSLGTSRTFGVSAIVDPAKTGVADFSAGGANANWWTWSANAIELRSAFFNNDTTNGNITRFFFQNTGADASYSATCYSDDAAKTVTYGTAKSGTLRTGQTTLTAADVCTFSAGQRGAITFTINAPAKNVKGVYQQAINGVTAGYLALERPYANGTY